MKIALLNKRIIIQRQQVISDKVGNRINEWTKWLECFATISGEGGQEVIAAGTVNDHADCHITVRWCEKHKSISSTGYRIVIDDEIYDILSIDHLSNKRKALKFRCRKVRR